MRLINKYFIGDEVWFFEKDRPKRGYIDSINHGMQKGIDTPIYCMVGGSYAFESDIYRTEEECSAAVLEHARLKCMEQCKLLITQCTDLLDKLNKFKEE